MSKQIISPEGILEVVPLRNLGFWTIWALGVGSVVGDGIFLLLGSGIATAGPSASLSYLLAGVFQLFLMVAMGEMAIGMPTAGAMSVWVERTMGDWWGLLSGFGFAFGWVIGGGGISIALGRITCWYFPSLDVNTWTIVFAILFISLFCLLNILGGVIAAKTQLYFVLVLVLLMVLFSVVGFKDIDPTNFTPFMPFGWEGFWLAFPLGTYAYLGAATLATAGAECKNPADLPKALVWSSVTFLALYTAAMLVVTGILPWETIGMEASPFTLAAEKSIGYIGGLVINTAAWLAAATCLIMGTIYAPSRIFYSQSIAGYLPKFFGKLSAKTHTPVQGIIFIWVISVVLILIATVNPDFVYVVLSMQLVLAWMISWGLAIIASVLYRKQYPEEVAGLGWHQPLFPLFPVLGMIGILSVVYFTFVGMAIHIIYGLFWIIPLLIYYFVIAKPKIAKMGERRVRI